MHNAPKKKPIRKHIFFNNQIRNNYYLQLVLEEFKYIVKEQNMERFIKDDSKIYSDDPDKEVFDQELFNV